MDAKVITAFPGVPDGKVYPVEYKPGDTVSGDLAEQAIGAGLAEEIDESADPLATLKKAELETLAAERGVDISAAKTKADIIAALKAASVGA